MTRTQISLMGSDIEGRTVGTAYLPELAMGVDLAPLGYVEDEWEQRGEAAVWAYDEQLVPRIATEPTAYATRMLVRRPREAGASSGLVIVEPLHPDLDSAIVWDAIHPWILRGGHTWIGVTVYPHTVAQLRDVVAPVRYSKLSIPLPGQEYDILGAALAAARSGAIPGVAAEHVILGGMSATGSFCRVFSQDGFHERWSAETGQPIVDAYVIGISSSGAGTAGYPLLSPASAPLPPDDGRMKARGHGAIVFEVLSETESETHARAIRDDSDEPGDRYRLYQIAGTAHIESRASVLTNRQQYERAGLVKPLFGLVEVRSDGRYDLFLRAAYEHAWRWARDARAIPPRCPRFGFSPSGGFSPAAGASASAGAGEAQQLERDSDGNVLGGVRTPWVDVPTASYHPHGTAAVDAEQPPEWTPFGGPAMMAALYGSRRPFPLGELRRRHGSRAAYLDAFADATRRCVDAGTLLQSDAEELLRTAPARWER
jgi:hypothetical protein